MALFGKLFEKKICDLCGNEIKLLGNRKLEDGNCCKECAEKLSPWFSERRSSTVEEIRAHLAYREANKDAVEAFNTTKVLGLSNKKLYVDENAKKFAITGARNFKDANPDILDLSQVIGCEIEIDESKSEEKREYKDAEGKTQRESYNPPHYTFSYDFNVIVRVNHPYFNEMKFEVNRDSAEFEPPVARQSTGVIKHEIYSGRQPNVAPNEEERMANVTYAEGLRTAQEIKAILTNVVEEVRKAAAPKKAVVCPNCGATTFPDANGCCEYCGSALPQD